mmetsp:Transcript_4484/g.6059  ORF Transcript_4484/g.6059 Transcript_4484/m.6059 type:complete len:103 (-) Transcript_4484:292-600(-)|eukprot:CAMPEP_0196585014 /NCGR_PEP_ID=MMETSP1081-20130531/49335_1 /TAXON_ID=36882 /ORGANISM="Pyramimonas amylifera, Strain CCMP720" /LENGTH=102 /DNA_ID=CAMNT_0041906419 /DNA_START=105 /DNA_END=413 /DNA_ORIENTATION=+
MVTTTLDTSAAQGDLTLPLARVRRLIKSEKDVDLVSAEAAVLVSKATVLFLEKAAQLASEKMSRNQKFTLTYEDLAACVSETKSFHFLQDVVPEKKRVGDLL